MSGSRGDLELLPARSGHCYLTLKDEEAQLAGVIWRSVARGCRLPRTMGWRSSAWGI